MQSPKAPQRLILIPARCSRAEAGNSFCTRSTGSSVRCSFTHGLPVRSHSEHASTHLFVISMLKERTGCPKNFMTSSSYPWRPGYPVRQRRRLGVHGGSKVFLERGEVNPDPVGPGLIL